MIVQTSIDASAFEDNVVIVGEDIDLLVILSQLAPTVENIYFLKPGKGKTCEKMYTANSLSYPKLQNLIALMHAFTGCDTTSAFYNQGKMKIIKTLLSNSELVDKVEVFNTANAAKNDIISVRNYMIMALYGAKKNCHSLNEYRYNCFKKCTFKNSFKLENLPPTESATAQHSLRVYYQVQQRLRQKVHPVEWGWKDSQYGLPPIQTNDPLVPDDVLRDIRCRIAAKIVVA